MQLLKWLIGPTLFADTPIAPKRTPGHHKFIILGETGVGKSTVINMITNYLRNGSLENIKVAIPSIFYPKVTEKFPFIHSESNIKNRAQAQTQKANEYSFTNGQTKTSMIDTPGLNDTAGMEQDDKNLDIIVDAAINANEISGIVLVLNGTEARITPNIRMLLTRLHATLPDSITDNIVVVMTMCRPDTCNFTDFSQLGIQPQKVVYMNNTAFSSDPKTWRGTPTENFLKMEWDASINAVQELLQAIESLTPVSTNEFAKMKAIREKVRASLHQARMKINEKQQIIDTIEQKKVDAQKANTEAEQHKNFTTKKTITKYDLVPASYHSTICSRCNTVCHDCCSLDETPEGGDRSIFLGCCCMNGGTGKCNVCKEHCGYQDHYHARVTMKQTTVDVDEEIQDIKNKFLAAQGAEKAALEQLDSMTLASKAAESDILNLQKSIINECVELKKICKNYNLVDELQVFIAQLKQNARMLTSTEARTTADNFIAQMEELTNKFAELDKDKLASEFGVKPIPAEKEKEKKKGWLW